MPSLGRGSRTRRCAAARHGDHRSRGRLGLCLPAACFHSGDAYRTTGLDAAIGPPRANTPDNRLLPASRGAWHAVCVERNAGENRISVMTKMTIAVADDLKGALGTAVRPGSGGARAQVALPNSGPRNQSDARDGWALDTARPDLPASHVFERARHYLIALRRREDIRRGTTGPTAHHESGGGRATLPLQSPASLGRSPRRQPVESCTRGARRG